MAEESNNKKGTGFYFFGKLCAKVGLGLLAYIWLTKKFCKKEDCQCGGGLKNGFNVLVIDDENMSDYIEAYPYDSATNILTIPQDVTMVLFQTTKAVSIHNIMPNVGDFANGKELKVSGNWYPYMPNDEEEEYCFSTHIYQDFYSNNDGALTMKADYRNVSEFLCWRKQWWFSF